jgi:hypothetical protein
LLFGFVHDTQRHDQRTCLVGGRTGSSSRARWKKEREERVGRKRHFRRRRSSDTLKKRSCGEPCVYKEAM